MNIIIESFKSMIEFAFNITGDWGTAIVILTVVVKLAMMPLSIKQRIATKKQFSFSKEIEATKNKYKNNKKRQKEELNKLYAKSTKGLLGCIIPFAQIPIISALYMAIGRLPVQAVTILVPWVMDISLPDSNFVIPAIYILISIAPSLLSYIKVFDSKDSPIKISGIIPMIIIGLVITIKAPVALGIYFITSSTITLIENIGFRLYSRSRTC